MLAFGRAFLVMAALILSADVVRAAGVEDANAAVLAARDGKYDDAIRLFTNAINGDNLNLKSRAQAYAYRGYFALVLGDAQNASADLAKSAELKIWPYNALWLSLARMKANVPDNDAHSLAMNAAQFDLAQWPGAVVKFMMGQAKPEEVAAAANLGDPQKLVERVCDADFYIAEYDLTHNNEAAAKLGFQRAAEKCPFASFERMGATAELMRLK